MRTDALTTRLAGVAHWLLPWRCLLCQAPGADGLDLCPACVAEMPRNQHCCARCALPLPTPVPMCGQCQRRPPPWDAAWVPFRYAWPLDRLESRFKFGRDLAAGRSLARLWAQAPRHLARPDLIVPVPLHSARLRHRGYNQALELARPLTRAFGTQLQVGALRRVRATVAQTDLDARSRRRNLRGAFAVPAGTRLPPHIALIDDVMTTGATLAACAQALRRAGALRIDVWALARAPLPRA